MLEPFANQSVYLQIIELPRKQKLAREKASVAAKELKRLIAAGTSNSHSSSSIIRDKINRMQSLSEDDRHLIDLIQEKVSDQRREFVERQKTIRDLFDRFRQLEQIGRDDTNQIRSLQTQIQSQAEEIERIRAEKNSLVSLNDSLREQASTKREAYAAVVQQNRSSEVEVQNMNFKLAQLNTEIRRLRQEKDEKEGLGDQNESRLKSMIIETQKLLEVTQRDLDMVQKKAQALCEENSTLEQRLETDNQKLHASQTDNAELKTRLFSAGETIKQLEQANQQTVERIQFLQDQAAATDKRESRQARENITIIEQWKSQLDRATRYQHDYDILLDRFRSLLAELDVMSSQSHDLRETSMILLTAVNQQDETIHNLESEIWHAEKCRTMMACNSTNDCALYEAKRNKVEAVSLFVSGRLFHAQSDVASLKYRNQEHCHALDKALADVQASQAAASLAISSESSTNERFDRMLEMEHELRQATMQLVNVCEAMEGSFSCFTCMSLLQCPVTCIPCGHLVCSDCVGRGPCPECQAPINDTIPNPSLHVLAGKFTYITIVLAKLRQRFQETAQSMPSIN